MTDTESMVKSTNLSQNSSYRKCIYDERHRFSNMSLNAKNKKQLLKYVFDNQAITKNANYYIS